MQILGNESTISKEETEAVSYILHICYFYAIYDFQRTTIIYIFIHFEMVRKTRKICIVWPVVGIIYIFQVLAEKSEESRAEKGGYAIKSDQSR